MENSNISKISGRSEIWLNPIGELIFHIIFFLLFIFLNWHFISPSFIKEIFGAITQPNAVKSMALAIILTLAMVGLLFILTVFERKFNKSDFIPIDIVFKFGVDHCYIIMLTFLILCGYIVFIEKQINFLNLFYLFSTLTICYFLRVIHSIFSININTLFINK